MAAVDPGLRELTLSLIGEPVEPASEAFNLHYLTSSAFLKVTRPWVRPDRARTDLLAAGLMADAGVPVARPLFTDLHSYRDADGHERWVTYWERLRPVAPLSEDEALSVSAEWIHRIFQMAPPPELSYCFQLNDFLHAVQVRLAGSRHPFTPRILEAVERFSLEEPYRHPGCDGLIHGDLHPDNMLNTTDGLRIIDWESACCGPLEWDAAQNVRYSPLDLAPERFTWWVKRGADPELMSFYREVRSMSSLSHMVATGLRPPQYYRTLEFLGWEPEEL